jgi:HlyD family secretion protein
MNKIKIIVLVLIVVGIVTMTGCFSKTELENVFTGNLESDSIDVSTEVAGIIKDVYVKEGDFVNTGDLIAEIDVTELELEKNKLEAIIRGSEASFSKVKVGAKDGEIDKAMTQIRQQQSNTSAINEEYKLMETQYKQNIDLYEVEVISKNNLDKSELQFNTAKERLNAAHEQLKYLQEQLLILKDGATVEELVISESQYESSLASLAILEHKISKSKVYAKASGAVKTINYQVGELIPQYAKLASLEDIDNIWVQIYIPEKELYKINLDEIVDLRNTYDESMYEGRVVYIANSGEFTPKNTESKESRQEIVFKVKIALLEDSKALKPGMLVDIVLGEDNND